ncbi:MAG: hypothetical protein IJN21_05115, partial [Clostridia bacterium]|nr:hypothetical protein [Clostridia bacterium]
MKKNNTYEIDFVNEQIIVSKAFLKASARKTPPSNSSNAKSPEGREKRPTAISTIPICANLSLQRKE